jgi:hypothetical protein
MRLAVTALFLVGFLFGSASADRKVDWSQYLEKPGERVPKKATPAVAKSAKPDKKVKRAAAAKRPAKAVAKRTGRRR